MYAIRSYYVHSEWVESGFTNQLWWNDAPDETYLNILKEIEKYRRRIENGPVVEKEYSMLTHGYENARNNFV